VQAATSAKTGLELMTCGAWRFGRPGILSKRSGDPQFRISKSSYP
jgi:hypothetical protein